MTLPQAQGDQVPIVLNQGGRICYGRLHLHAEALHFVCVHDESAAAAAAGQAVASRFGLVGGLIGGAVSAVRTQRRDKAIDAALEKIAGLPLAEQMKQNPQSRTFARAELLGWNESRWTGKALQLRGGRVPVFAVDDGARQVVTGWLAQRGLPVKLVKPFSLRTKLILFLSPVWLAALYVLVSLPWAIQKSSHTSAVAKRYDEVLTRARAALSTIGDAPSGSEAATACAQLPPVGYEAIAGYVGALPGDADRGILADYERFPRTVESMRYDGRAEIFSSEIPQWSPRTSFGSSWGDILGEAPTDWGRRARDVYPLRDFTGTRYLAVAKVRSFRAPTQQGYLAPIRQGRAELGVKVIDLASGATACQGDLTVALPSSRPAGSVADDLKRVLADGLAAAALTAPCPAGGAELCAAVVSKIDRLAPGTPDPAAAAPAALDRLTVARPPKHRRHH
jgi:hypothetical protein